MSRFTESAATVRLEIVLYCSTAIACSSYAARTISRYEMGADAVAGARGRGLLGVLRQMSVAGGGADLGVSEELADHGQALAERKRFRGVAVAQVVDAHALQSGARLDAVPEVVETRQMRAVLLAPDDPGIALDAPDAVKHL